MASSNGPSAQSPGLGSAPFPSTFTEEDIHAFMSVMGEDEELPPQKLPAHDDAPVSATAASTCPTHLAHAPTQQHTAAARIPSSESSTVATTVAATACEDEAKAQARSERKRSREKQRRSDVNKQFADLAQLIRKIETEDSSTRFVTKASNGLPLASRTGPTNRVDLMARTIHMLEQLHETNKKHKVERSSLEKQVEDSKKLAEDTAARLKEATLYQQAPSKQVVMMVPMMMSPSSDGSTAQMPMTAPPGAFMQPQPFMNTMAGYPGAQMPAYAVAPQAALATAPAATVAPKPTASQPASAPAATVPPTVGAAPPVAAPSAAAVAARQPPPIAAMPVAAAGANMMMQPQYQMMFPQPMMPSTMMVPGGVAATTAAAPTAATAQAPAAAAPSQPQGQPKSTGTTDAGATTSVTGENLAHCA